MDKFRTMESGAFCQNFDIT